jgi:hypothetical protein
MWGNHEQVRLASSIKLGEPSVVLLHHLPIECDHPLECGESTWNRCGSVDRAVVKDGSPQ